MPPIAVIVPVAPNAPTVPLLTTAVMIRCAALLALIASAIVLMVVTFAGVLKSVLYSTVTTPLAAPITRAKFEPPLTVVRTNCTPLAWAPCARVWKLRMPTVGVASKKLPEAEAGSAPNPVVANWISPRIPQGWPPTKATLPSAGFARYSLEFQVNAPPGLVAEEPFSRTE